MSCRIGLWRRASGLRTPPVPNPQSEIRNSPVLPCGSPLNTSSTTDNWRLTTPASQSPIRNPKSAILPTLPHPRQHRSQPHGLHCIAERWVRLVIRCFSTTRVSFRKLRPPRHKGTKKMRIENAECLTESGSCSRSVDRSSMLHFLTFCLGAFVASIALACILSACAHSRRAGRAHLYNLPGDRSEK